MNEQGQTPPSVQFKDRTVGLVVFGVLQILIGAFCALAIPLMLLSLWLGQAGGAAAVNARTMIPVIAQYALAAVIAVWLGIGSILARRWARALTLVLAWIGLICGVLGLLFFFVFMGDMYQQLAQEQKMPPQAVVVMQVVTGAVLGCIYVFLPGIFILFYRSKHVWATCRFKDPQVRWTDKCPLPVLAVSLLLGFGACSVILCAPAYGAVFPWFGVLLEGPAALSLLLVDALLLACLAWGTYKLKKWAWLGTIALMALWGVSAIVTFSRVSIRVLYEKMSFPEEQFEIIEKSGLLEKMNMPWMMGIFCAAYLAYLLYVGRYFFSSTAQQHVS
ncbi:MAG: hypothetical protein A2V98_19445 [Planctomycetes bacterium RBG_16_64_12]|nr:MAG: hypothetical protein A2V98_19445 [Planctomycetes bacterium RBG_16_64_12]